MSALDDARREELAEALAWLDDNGPGDPRSLAKGLAPLIARWLTEARAEGAAEVAARVEAAVEQYGVPVVTTGITIVAADRISEALTPPDTT